MPASSVTIDRKDPRFDTLKTGHNLRFPANDAEAASRILICSNTAETAEALQRIVSSGIRPTVRSGGHCYEDFVSNNPNGAIIDLSLHNTVDAGPTGSPFRIAPGASLGEVYQVLYKRAGVTIPAGTCATVGAGGHISGGGYGLLSRLHGLTVDWITGIDILTVDSKGKVIERRVDKLHDPDLFRACRGAGGGNFGIITNFLFDKLPTAPREVAEATLTFPWATMTEEKFIKLLALFGDYWEGRAKDPDTWGLSVVMVMGPNNNPNGRIGMHVQFCNPDGTASNLSVLQEFFQRFAEFDSTQSGPSAPGSTTSTQRTTPAGSPNDPYQIVRRPWLEATLAGGGSGGGIRAKYKSAYMKKTFTSAESSAIYKYLTSPQIDSHGSVLAIDGYGGATNISDRAHDTAMPQRSSIMKLQWQCYWRDPEQDAGRLKFMDDFFTAVYTGSHVSSDHQGTPYGERYEGCYMNYPDADMLRYSYWPQLYYGAGDLYPLLQRVKKQYDPNNIFHSSMSVRA
ncbi:FAD-binding oxidoreductase [Granulicella sp. dw_53]|uniref:FAD-binding oxidoreductase n=1 Tax=Granulicella sp. dw_53 TaxID=2719792 RepID=UPI0021080A9B|nr:FAD-binding oxidoreductase [Granulicella sp. dw_53]